MLTTTCCSLLYSFIQKIRSKQIGRAKLTIVFKNRSITNAFKRSTDQSSAVENKIKNKSNEDINNGQLKQF